MKSNRTLIVLTVFISVGVIIIFPVRAQSPEIPSDKLSNPEKIMSGFQNGQSIVKVIVNLVGPTKKMTGADWNRPGKLNELHDQVLDRQLEVISTLSAAEFMLRLRFENQAAFSAELTKQGLDKLSKNPMVRSIEPVEELELHLAQGIPLMNASLHRSTYNGQGVTCAQSFAPHLLTPQVMQSLHQSFSDHKKLAGFVQNDRDGSFQRLLYVDSCLSFEPT